MMLIVYTEDDEVMLVVQVFVDVRWTNKKEHSRPLQGQGGHWAGQLELNIRIIINYSFSLFHKLRLLF